MSQEEIQTDKELEETLELDESPQQEQQEQVQQEQTKEQSRRDMSFRALRESRDKAEQERNELRRELEQLRQMQMQKQQPREEEIDYSIAPDDLVEGKHLSKYDREIKRLREELSSYKQQSQAFSVEAKLTAKYPDFNTVVSTDNIYLLREAYPEIVDTINSSPNLYSKMVSAYTLIKKLGIHSENHEAEKDRKIIAENAQKPKTATSVGGRPQGTSALNNAYDYANMSSEERRKEIRRQALLYAHNR